jgi:hypothetical protein
MLKKQAATIVLVCLITGTVIALVGLYSMTFTIAVIGLLLILISILIAEILHRKPSFID